MNDVKENISEIKDELLDEVEDVVEDANEFVDETIEVIHKEVKGFEEELTKAAKETDDEGKEKINKIKKDVKHAVDTVVSAIGKIANDLKEDEDLKEKLHDFRVKSTELINEGFTKVKGLKDDPVWQQRFEHAKEVTVEAGEKVADVASKTSANLMSKARENEKVDEFMDKAEDVGSKAFEATKETFETTKEKVEEFFAKPEVVEKVESAKATTIKVAEKAFEGLKKLLKPKTDEHTSEDE